MPDLSEMPTDPELSRLSALKVAMPKTVTPAPLSNTLRSLWEGFLVAGGLTLLTSEPKMGKSVLLSHLLRTRQDGGSLLGQRVTQGRTWVVTEEQEGVWGDSAYRLGIDPATFVEQAAPFGNGRATPAQWQGLCETIAPALPRYGIDLLVIDTWGGLVPCDDENRPGPVQAALGPLSPIRKAGVAVLLVHHSNKSGNGDPVNGSRGSNALPGEADIAITLGSGSPSRERRLTIKARRGYSDLQEVRATLSEDGKRYEVATDRPNRNENADLSPGAKRWLAAILTLEGGEFGKVLSTFAVRQVTRHASRAATGFYRQLVKGGYVETVNEKPLRFRRVK